jgi:hypothetical protein
MKTTHVVVVDADVVTAAGETTHPTSINCRRVLEEILHVCHKVSLSRDLRIEWDRHQSRYTSQWRVAMESRGKVLPPAKDSPSFDETADEILETADSSQTRSTMQKDMHLLRDALRSDSRIVSLDETARRLFAHAAQSVDAIKRIAWLNPDDEEAPAAEWLASGAKAAESVSLHSEKVRRRTARSPTNGGSAEHRRR